MSVFRYVCSKQKTNEAKVGIANVVSIKIRVDIAIMTGE